MRGAATYGANLNSENPIGTVQSIEHALRSLERHQEDDRKRVANLEKTRDDYAGQSNKPFEHEHRLRELLARQALLNAALDLDKGEQHQVAEAVDGPEPDIVSEPAPPGSFVARLAARNATSALRRR